MRPQSVAGGKTDWHNCVPLCVPDYRPGPEAAVRPWRGYLVETLDSEQGGSPAHEARAGLWDRMGQRFALP